MSAYSQWRSSRMVRRTTTAMTTMSPFPVQRTHGCSRYLRQANHAAHPRPCDPALPCDFHVSYQAR
jgi:hypothetical protein